MFLHGCNCFTHFGTSALFWWLQTNSSTNWQNTNSWNSPMVTLTLGHSPPRSINQIWIAFFKNLKRVFLSGIAQYLFSARLSQRDGQNVKWNRPSRAVLKRERRRCLVAAGALGGADPLWPTMKLEGEAGWQQYNVLVDPCSSGKGKQSWRTETYIPVHAGGAQTRSKQTDHSLLCVSPRHTLLRVCATLCV